MGLLFVHLRDWFICRFIYTVYLCISWCMCFWKVSALSRLKYVDAWCVFFWATTPTLVCVATFATLVIVRGEGAPPLRVSSVFAGTYYPSSPVSPVYCSICLVVNPVQTCTLLRRTSLSLCLWSLVLRTLQRHEDAIYNVLGSIVNMSKYHNTWYRWYLSVINHAFFKITAQQTCFPP